MNNFGPRAGVALFVVRDGKILFMHRQSPHGKGTWSAPGGHVEYGESPEDAARREALEETGVEVGPMRLATVTNDFFAESGKHYITLWYVASWQASEPQILEPSKCSEIRWVEFGELPQPTFLVYDNLTPEQERLLQQAIDEEEKR